MWKIVLALVVPCVLCVYVPPESSTRKEAMFHEQKSTRSDAARLSRSSAAPLYYDRRERITRLLTFEWRYENNQFYTKEYVLRTAKAGQSLPSQTSEQLDEGVTDLDAEHFLIQGLQGTCTIRRTPEITYIYENKEVPLIANGRLSKFESRLTLEQYYLGDCGEVIVSILGFGGEKGTADIAFAEFCGFGLPDRFLGLWAGRMIFLGGISPFRLLGSTPDDWRLVSVDENEWVFELQPEEQKKEQMTGMLKFDKVRIHLSRQHEDVPTKIEIIAGDSYERWMTLAYRNVRGVWVPEKVMLEYKVQSQGGWILYDLVGVSSSVPITITIPEGAPVHDWRLLGRAVWRGVLDESRKIETQWSAELLRDIWRQIQRESGSTSQREEQK